MWAAGGERGPSEEQLLLAYTQPFQRTEKERTPNCPFVHPPTHSSIHPPFCPHIYPFVCPSIHPPIHLLICPSVYPPIQSPIYPSIHPSPHLSVRPSPHLTIHPSMQVPPQEQIGKIWSDRQMGRRHELHQKRKPKQPVDQEDAWPWWG